MQFRFSNLCLGLLVLTFTIACSRQTALTTKADSDIEKTFEELALDTPPDKLYQVFNDFCRHYFGANTDPIYDSLGKSLSIVEKGHWAHISERSAAVAWETNLPARSYVEYGLTQQYGMKTQEAERFFFVHTHYLKDLRPETLYYYKVVSIEFFSDYSNKNFVFKNSTVKILVADSTSAKAACVDTQGAFNDRSTHLPIYYKNTILASNICNIRFGDAYGQGSNHRFVNCQLQRTDDRNPNYHTFIVDGGSSVFNHVLQDCDFQKGTHYDDVYWENTGSHSNYTVQWTFTLETNPGAAITIRDRSGSVVVADKAGANGVIVLPLPQCTIRPLEWDPAGEPIPVMKKSQHQKEMFSPYSVTVSLNGIEKTQIVDVESKTAMRLFLK